MWTRLDRRWRDEVLQAILPPHAHGVRGGRPVDRIETFWHRFQETAPPMLRWGLRAAVWTVTLSPLLVLGRVRSFGGLSHEERDRCLVRAHGSRIYLLRQALETLKVVACLAAFQDATLREEVGGALLRRGDSP